MTDWFVPSDEAAGGKRLQERTSLHPHHLQEGNGKILSPPHSLLTVSLNHINLKFIHSKHNMLTLNTIFIMKTVYFKEV